MRSELGGKMGGVGQLMGSTAGRSFGMSLLANVGSSLDSLGGAIVSTIGGAAKRGAFILGGAFAGLAGFSLVGGLGRLLDTEDATVQLKRMGLSLAEVDTLLAAVDTTFDGTPFANPDGFNISSQLFASGRGLAEIPGILGNIADFAAHGNVPLDQMGDIFRRIAGQGRVTGFELERLTDANIPLAQLSATIGLTESELRAMVTAGELSADQFFEMVDAADIFKGAAKAAGDTTRGAFSNVKTALKRLGEAFLSPLFGENGQMVQWMKTLLANLKGLVPAVTELGERFAAWLVPAVASLTDWLQNRLVPAVQRVIEFVRQGITWYREHEDAIRKVIAAVLPAAGAIAGLATAVHLVGRAFLFLRVATPIGLLLAIGSALVFAWQNSERFRDIVSSLLSGDWRRAWSLASDVVGGFAGRVGEVLGSIASNVLSFVRNTDWSTVGGAIRDGIVDAANVAFQVLTTAAAFVADLVAKVAGWLLDADWSVAGRNIVKAINSAVNFAVDVGSPVLDFVDRLGADIEERSERVDWTAAGRSIVTNFADGISGAAGERGDVFDPLKNPVTRFLLELGVTVQNAELRLRRLGSIRFPQFVAGWLAELANQIERARPFLLRKGREFLIGLWSGITSFWSGAIVPWLEGIGQRALDAVPQLLSWLVDKGKQLLGGILVGLTAFWTSDIKPWLADTGQRALDAVPQLLSWLVDKGKQLLGGIRVGLTAFWTSDISPWLVGIGQRAVDATPQLLSALVQKGKDLLAGLRTGLEAFWQNDIRLWFAGLPGRLRQVFVDAASWLLKAGGRIASGLWSGFINALDSIPGVGVLKNALGISSGISANVAPDAIVFDVEFRLQADVDGFIAHIKNSINRVLANIPFARQFRIFHEGGIVPGGPGQESLAVLEGREMVLNMQMQRNLLSLLSASPNVEHTRDGRRRMDAPLVGTLNVGSRDDVAPMREALAELAWRQGVGS